MKKIKLIGRTNKKYSYDLATKLHGWIMDNLPIEVADQFHLSQVNPYSIRVLSRKDNYIVFEVALLNDYAISTIEPLLTEENFKKLKLGNNKEVLFSLYTKEIEELSLNVLTDTFYTSAAVRAFELDFLTSTSFKANGEITFFPDLRLIFQNIMHRYAMIFDETNSIDGDLLQEIIDKTKIVSYSIRSSYFPIHGKYVPGYIGKIKIRCNGTQTLRNYVKMLLQFAEYSGVGIKTSMGMGKLTYRELYK